MLAWRCTLGLQRPFFFVDVEIYEISFTDAVPISQLIAEVYEHVFIRPNTMLTSVIFFQVRTPMLTHFM